MNSRERMDVLKERLVNTAQFDDLLDAINSCIDTTAEEIQEEMGIHEGYSYIALREIFGLTDRYTAEEIDNEVNEEE